MRKRAPTNRRAARPELLLLVLVSSAFAFARPATAFQDTTLAITGLSAPVTLLTDGNGIPHLEAANLADLYLAWGFVTARDRLWQMEHMRQGARGELWRWFGNRSLRADGGAQLFQLAEHAERSWGRERNDPRVRVALGRYAAGVNAWLTLCRSGRQPWPRELTRLGARPADWTPADSYLTLLAMGVLLDLAIPELQEAETLRVRGDGWYARRRRFESDWIHTTIPDSAAARLYGAGAPRGDLGFPTSLGRAFGARFPGLPGARDPELGASNIFAVGPRRSASGRPLVANDVHLSLTAPGPFHAIHLRVADTLDAVGGCVPGLPIVVSGRNAAAAWGITSLGADVLDVYTDSLSRDGRSVLWQGRWTPLREASYRMRFRALGIPLPPFGQKRRYTPRGPVVEYDRKRGVVFSVRWTALEAPLTLVSLIGLERSGGAAEAAARCRTLITPTLNVVAADRAGRVVYQTVGALPRRLAEPPRGVLRGAASWRGTIPPDSMPRWEPPAAGFVVNGNNLPVGSSYPYALPRFDWIQDRAARMAERLAGDDEVSLEDARSIQNDVFSRAAARALPWLLLAADSLRPGLSPRERAALDTLAAWDHACLRWKVAPTLFRAWYRTYLDQAGLGDAPGLAAAALDGRARDVLRDTTGAKLRPATAATRALKAALAALETKLGPELSSWTWARAHRARFRHALEWREPRLAPPTLGMDGDNSTPSVGPSRLPGDVHVTFGPAWRHLVDLAADSSLAIVPPGNRGEPPHDRDHLQRWASHRYVPLHLDWRRVRALKESEWRLVPR